MDTPKAGKINLQGIVTEALPNAEFRIQLEGDRKGELILGYLGGKMKLNRIRVLIGDRVAIEQDINGGKGRITRRF